MAKKSTESPARVMFLGTAVTMLVYWLVYDLGADDPQFLKEMNNGQEFIERENWDAAIDCFSMAIRLEPDDAIAYHNRGVAYEKLGDKAKADADFAKADELRAKE